MYKAGQSVEWQMGFARPGAIWDGSALLGSAWLVAEVWLDEDDDDMMMMTMTNLKSTNRIASQSTEPQINQYRNQ